MVVLYLVVLVSVVYSLQYGELLGEGAFGKVYKGYLHGNDSGIAPAVVAVKMLKGIISLFSNLLASCALVT